MRVDRAPEPVPRKVGVLSEKALADGDQRFPILDVLRGLLALTVVLGHVGMPPIFGAVDQADNAWGGLARIWRTFAFGPPAVIAFFVISGFCIHFPFSGARENLSVLRFYLRRYLRIGVPILTAVVILKLFQPDMVILGPKSVLWRSTLWSVLCEEIYYMFYPLLLLVQRRYGMKALLLSTTPISLAITAGTFPSVDWPELGVIGTTVVLLPVWLLGMLLAEWARSREAPLQLDATFGIAIAWWRVTAFVVMWIALMLHFHGGFHQTASALIVGAFAYLWLRAELATPCKPNRFLLWFGAWSYSLYLVHPISISFAMRQGLEPQTSLVAWALTMTLTQCGAYLFFLVVERPSHRLARKVSLRDSRADGAHTGKATN